MKILPQYNKINLSNYNICKTNPYRRIDELKTDSVSFRGNSPVENSLSPIEETSLKLAKKLMKLERSDSLNTFAISQVLNEFSPVPITIKPLSEIPSQIQAMSVAKIGAHMLPFYTPDLKLNNVEIYLGNAKNAKEAGKLISDTAHEFTHVLQRQADKSYFGIREYTDEIDEITTLVRISQTIYNELIKKCSNAIITNAAFQRAAKTMTSFSPEFIAKYLEQQNVLRNLNAVTDSMSELILSSPQMSTLRENSKLDTKTIKEVIRKAVVKQAQMEEEAYNTTVAVLKKWGKVDEQNLINKQISRDINHLIANNLII